MSFEDTAVRAGPTEARQSNKNNRRNNCGLLLIASSPPSLLPRSQAVRSGKHSPTDKRTHLSRSGQEYYHATRINVFRGERWFCSGGMAQV